MKNVLIFCRSHFTLFIINIVNMTRNTMNFEHTYHNSCVNYYQIHSSLILYEIILIQVNTHVFVDGDTNPLVPAIV